jgi:hypothetical protein
MWGRVVKGEEGETNNCCRRWRRKYARERPETPPPRTVRLVGGGIFGGIWWFWRGWMWFE